MNGIEKITAKIELDAQNEIDAILNQAKAEAAEITAQYEAQAKAEAEEILARGAKAAAEREDRLASMAQMEGRKAELAAKQEVIEDAFALALKKLQALPEEEYVELLANLAVSASANGKEALIFSAADRDRVGKKVVMAANAKLANAPELPDELADSKVGAILDKVVTGAAALINGVGLTLSDETRSINGGFILSDGTVEVNCTFDTLVRLQRGALSGQVAKVLFE